MRLGRFRQVLADGARTPCLHWCEHLQHLTRRATGSLTMNKGSPLQPFSLGPAFLWAKLQVTKSLMLQPAHTLQLEPSATPQSDKQPLSARVFRQAARALLEDVEGLVSDAKTFCRLFGSIAAMSTQGDNLANLCVVGACNLRGA